MRIVKILLAISLFLGFCISSEFTFAEDALTADEIITKSRLAFYYAGDDMRTKVSMELINKDGQKRIRELTMLRKDYEEGGNPSFAEASPFAKASGDRSEGRQKYFMYFHKPADVKDTTFMVYKYPNKDDDRWLFIPAINLVKRIAANDKYSSFVGSDFTYEDVSGRKPEEDSHTLLRKEKLGEKSCFVIEGTPKEPSEYIKRISWIDETNFLPLKEQFYDKQDELYREFLAQELKDINPVRNTKQSSLDSKISNGVNGILTITKRVMKNIKTGHRTEVTFQEVEYNLGIEDDVFSERYLRRPPSQWIR